MVSCQINDSIWGTTKRKTPSLSDNEDVLVSARSKGQCLRDNLGPSQDSVPTFMVEEQNSGPAHLPIPPGFASLMQSKSNINGSIELSIQGYFVLLDREP